MFNSSPLLNKLIDSIGIKLRITWIQAHDVTVVVVYTSLPIDDVEDLQHLVRYVVAVSAVELFNFAQNVYFFPIYYEIFRKERLNWRRWDLLYFLSAFQRIRNFLFCLPEQLIVKFISQFSKVVSENLILGVLDSSQVYIL